MNTLGRSIAGSLFLAAWAGCGTPGEPAAELVLDVPVNLDTKVMTDMGGHRAGFAVSPLGGFMPGHTTTVMVTGAASGETVYLGYSITGIGPGPCPGVFGGLCLDLDSPLVHGNEAADGDGTALFDFAVPAFAPAGAEISLQAVIARGAGGVDSVKTTARTFTLVNPVPPDGASPDPVLGDGSHSMSSKTTTVLANAADGVDWPTDVELNPYVTDELWATNMGSNTNMLVSAASSGSPSPLLFGSDTVGMHFNAEPSAIAFGNLWDGKATVATSHNTSDCTQFLFGTFGPCVEPDGFMGPTWFSADPLIHDSGHSSHLDMLHNSPLAMGISSGDGVNLFWVYDGHHRAITSYEFNSDHGLGGADHSDGEVHRYVEGEVGYVPDVPSHLDYDPSSELLYIADSGDNQIKVLDTTTGATGAHIAPNYDGTLQRAMTGASLSVLIEGSDVGMVMPSGLEVVGSTIYVSDNVTSVVFAFGLDGTLNDWLDTELPAGSLGGIEVGPDGSLYVADATGDRLLRIHD